MPIPDTECPQMHNTATTVVASQPHLQRDKLAGNLDYDTK